MYCVALCYAAHRAKSSSGSSLFFMMFRGALDPIRSRKITDVYCLVYARFDKTGSTRPHHRSHFADAGGRSTLRQAQNCSLDSIASLEHKERGRFHRFVAHGTTEKTSKRSERAKPLRRTAARGARRRRRAPAKHSKQLDAADAHRNDARPLRVVHAAQGTLFRYGPRHARQAEHVSWRLGIREKSVLRINRLHIMGI